MIRRSSLRPSCRTLLRRAAAGAALVTALGLVSAPGTPARAAAPAAPRVDTALSIGHGHRVGAAGSVDLVRGRLHVRRLGLPGRPVTLLSRTEGASDWTVEGVHRTGRRGVVRFRVDPDTLTAYRLVFAGTARLQPAESGSVRVAVRPDVRIAADPTSIDQGASTTISGAVSLQGAPLAGARVKLWRVVVGHPRSAHVIGRTTTDADGLAAFADTPRATSRYRLVVLRSATDTGDTVPGAVSAAVRVDVSPPTAS